MTKKALSEEMYLDQRIIQLKDLASKKDVDIEIVENSNGTAIKFPNGIMICVGIDSGTSNLYDFWGQFKRTEENLSITFPAPFKENPISIQMVGGYSQYIVSAIPYMITETGFTYVCLKPNNVTKTDYYVRYEAIGKWK